MAACPRPSSTARVVVVVWGGTFPFTLLNVDRGLAGHTSPGNRDINHRQSRHISPREASKVLVPLASRSFA